MGQRRSPLDVVELERLAARGWRGSEAEPLGGWLLRAGGAGFTSRAHSALVTGDPGMALPAAVAAVTDWYRARGLRPCAQVPGRQARAADAAFAAAGWREDTDTLMLTADLGDVGGAGPGSPASMPDPRALATVSATPDAAWLAAARNAGEPLPAGAATVLTHADRPAFATIRSAEGAVLGVARGVLTDDWLGITAVHVSESARGRGLATSLTRSLGAWAVEGGARWGYLQVVEDNAPARALYRRLAFIKPHRYHYRRAPGC